MGVIDYDHLHLKVRRGSLFRNSKKGINKIFKFQLHPKKTIN